jgi:hypothetical protein
MGVAAWRSLGHLCLTRLALTAITAIIVMALPGIPGTVTLGITFAGILIICVTEQLIISPEMAVDR